MPEKPACLAELAADDGLGIVVAILLVISSLVHISFVWR